MAQPEPLNHSEACGDGELDSERDINASMLAVEDTEGSGETDNVSDGDAVVDEEGAIELLCESDTVSRRLLDIEDDGLRLSLSDEETLTLSSVVTLQDGD